MAKKVRKGNEKRGRRPIIGGVALFLVVLAGLSAFLLYGSEDQRWSSDDLTSEVLIFVFIPAALVDNDDSADSIYTAVIAFAAIAMVGAAFAALRREWRLAWICSLFGTIFGPLTLIGVYLIGTSDRDFTQGSLLDKPEETRDGSSHQKSPFMGVIAVVATSLLFGRSSTILVSITGSLVLSLLIWVGVLILIHLVVTTVHSMLKS